MLHLATVWVLLIIGLSVDAKRYNLVVRTSKWPLNSGTSEDVLITLHGKAGRHVAKRFNGWGLDKFELGSEDKLTIEGEDIGPIVNVEAQIIKTGYIFDTWRLFWVKVRCDGNEYKATFEHTFSRDGHKSFAKFFEVVKCRAGYQVSDDGGMRTCLDRDECLVTCREQGQKCTNTPGSYKCECKPGFYLDGTVCKDYDECSSHHRNPCSYSNAHCVNTPGNYECRCNTGYQGDYFACQDKDECLLGQHECTQKCLNTPGSFKCGCRAGFKLAVDGKTCLDVDECKGANKCNTTTSVCYDEYGGHRCVCKVGYKKHIVGKETEKEASCIPVECKPLQGLDASIRLLPERCTNGKNYFGEECSVQCAPGYELAADSAKKTKCTANGFVTVGGHKLECKPKPCPPLEVPNFGYTVPYSCSSVGTTQGKECYMYCDEGFILAGTRTFKCNLQKYDNDPSKSLCTKIPKITCPNNIELTLPNNKGRLALGNKFPYFKTNLRQDQVTANIKDVGPLYEFPAGLTVVAYTAKNEINQTDACSFTVRVIDKTPPVVKNCPVSPTFVSKGGAQVNVTWKEPSFKDNVKIQNIDVIGENGIMRNPTSFNVRYSAVDTSGNTALCKFTVYFNVLNCNFDSIPGGDNFIHNSCFSVGTGSLCSAQCPESKTFDVINSNHPFIKFMWICNGGDFGVKRMPDCVDFTPKNGSCPEGYTEVQNYRNMEKVCGKCPRGTYFNNRTCIPCPRNTYQSNEGSLNCTKCGPGKGTITMRNKLQTDCKALCPRGFASKSGLSGSCRICPKDTYADKLGSKTCKKCPNGTSTDGQGRSSIDFCYYAPKNIKMSPTGTVEVSAGDDVSFSCLAEGRPLPFVLIRKQKDQADPTRHSLLPVKAPNSETKGLKYSIRKATIHDSGTYVCKAENLKGDAYANIELVVTEGSGMAPAI